MKADIENIDKVVSDLCREVIELRRVEKNLGNYIVNVDKKIDSLEDIVMNISSRLNILREYVYAQDEIKSNNIKE